MTKLTLTAKQIDNGKVFEMVRPCICIKYTALRYFNAAGAIAGGMIGEDHTPETHQIPNVLKAAKCKAHLSVFGEDYDTPDGTCIRSIYT